MNGAHDMGGMHGFGPVQPETDEPVFHAPWEGRVYAMRRLMGAWRRWNIDAGRHSIERMPAADYLRSSYYEKWLQSLETLMVEKGQLGQAAAYAVVSVLLTVLFLFCGVWLIIPSGRRSDRSFSFALRRCREAAGLQTRPRAMSDGSPSSHC